MSNKWKNINLINPSESDVKFEVTTFPDGEPHVKFLEEIDRKQIYVVGCRITNPSELFVLLQVGDILKRNGVEYGICITYLMSQRMDRVVNFEEAFTLDIVAKLINSLGASKVTIYEAHSKRAFKLIDRSEPLTEIYHISDIIRAIDADGDVTLCYPDDGAYKRYGNDADLVNYDFLTMEKHRDLKNNGVITSIDVSKYPTKDVNKILIVDDLCDAGGTFAWSAKVLKELYPNAELNIFVKHAVNKVGLDKMSANFDHVYITNSYRDWDVSEYGNISVLDLFN